MGIGLGSLWIERGTGKDVLLNGLDWLCDVVGRGKMIG